MKLAVMQPYFLPYLGYWQLIAAVDTFILYDDVNYFKKGYINRNQFLIGGQPTRLTLSLKKASQNKLIKDIHVGDNRQAIADSLKQSYANSPSFHLYQEELLPVISNPVQSLSQYLGEQIQTLCQLLNIPTQILYSSELDRDRNLNGQNAILDLAKRQGATTYINAIGGQELYQFDAFVDAGLKLNFLKPHIPHYDQGTGEWHPNLSIVDVMAHTPPDLLQQQLNQASLITSSGGTP